ncbi:hypothetical protein GCM10010310_31140 [Streptomyces violaceolatus]|uniref:Uncharacterized protein n=1 Tax=Streptomyces violaceolatus TaxID=67378 RepID=A0ABN3SPL0_9ACTN
MLEPRALCARDPFGCRLDCLDGEIVGAQVLTGPDTDSLEAASESLAARLRCWNRRTAVHGPHTDGVGTYSNQSKATVSSVAYMPITRPVKPQATSVDR